MISARVKTWQSKMKNAIQCAERGMKTAPQKTSTIREMIAGAVRRRPTRIKGRLGLRVGVRMTPREAMIWFAHCGYSFC